MTECPCGTPTRDEAYVCDTCLNDLTRVLAETPWLAGELEVSMSKQRGIDYRAERGNGNTPLARKDVDDDGDKRADAGTSLPYNYPASAALSRLRAALLAWTTYCQKQNIRHQSPKNALPRLDPVGMSAWLMWRVDGLAFDTEGPRAVDDITRAFRHGKGVIDRPADKWFAGPCNWDVEGAACGRDMYVTPGKEFVQCPACGTEYKVAARRQWLLDSAEDQLATATEIARAVTVLTEAGKGTTTMVRLVGDWVAAGRLVTRGHVNRRGQDRPTYRVGDVVKLVHEHMAREQARQVRA